MNEVPHLLDRRTPEGMIARLAGWYLAIGGLFWFGSSASLFLKQGFATSTAGWIFTPIMGGVGIVCGVVGWQLGRGRVAMVKPGIVLLLPFLLSFASANTVWRINLWAELTARVSWIPPRGLSFDLAYGINPLIKWASGWQHPPPPAQYALGVNIVVLVLLVALWGARRQGQPTAFDTLAVPPVE